jgi:hypothetical protein
LAKGQRGNLQICKSCYVLAFKKYDGFRKKKNSSNPGTLAQFFSQKSWYRVALDFSLVTSMQKFTPKIC